MTNLASKLGACPGPLRASQLTRLGGGYNQQKRAWQTLIYLDPVIGKRKEKGGR